MSNWAVNQRLFNIYDGPAYQDSNAYLDTHTSGCGVPDDKCMYLPLPGKRLDASTGKGYLPNAAIGWKQPNGFYYPPAFHSRGLFFSNVDIRHYLVVPMFKDGTYNTDIPEMTKHFFAVDPGATNIFAGYTDVDRQTVLNDHDGTLTGFAETISVNLDKFFRAPVQAPECRANIGVTPAGACDGKPADKTTSTARTSPYEYVTTVVYPSCALRVGNDPVTGACGSATGTPEPCEKVGDELVCGTKRGNGGKGFTKVPDRGGDWSKDCAGPFCTGVQLYRQYLTDGPNREWPAWNTNCGSKENRQTDKCNYPFIRLAGASEWQRNALTANHGKYFIDTTRTRDFQEKTQELGEYGDEKATYVDCRYKTNPNGNCEPRSVNVFLPDHEYLVFFLFARPTTKQTYHVYVGKGFNPQDATQLRGIRITGREENFKAESWTMPDSWRANAKMIPNGGDGQLDVLEIQLDFGAVKENLDPLKADSAEVCQPKDYCTGSGSGCSCALKDGDARLLGFIKEDASKIGPTSVRKMCDTACKVWSVRTLDCPKEGCLGFAFKTRSATDFTPGTYKRPAPEAFPSPTAAKDAWTWQFKPATDGPDAKSGGDCFYDAIPSTMADSKCTVRD